MRNFLPIKGPGGRNLTGKEKIALLVLVVTLLLCVLTLVAGEKAYLLDEAPNPVFSIVSAFGSALGGGIVALYALIMVWSALIYLKGERVADVTPIVGRCAAAFAVTVGISGALGIAHLEAAGGLGDLVGRSLGNTFGAGAGFPILILLMLLGAHLASQGAWTALREPMMPAIATPGSTLAPVGYGFGLAEAPESRLQDGPPLPDDGDPTADERSLAVQQAVEEIERSQGVTIVDVEPPDDAQAEADEDAEAETVGDETRSIGEEVDEAPAPEADTEEAEVQRGLAAVAHALEVTRSATEDDVEDDEEQAKADEEARYHSERHGLVPVPVGEAQAETAEDEEEAEEDEDEFAEVEHYEDEDEEVYETAEDEDEEDEADYEDEDVREGEYAEDDEELEEEEDDGEYAEYDEEEPDDGETDEADGEEDDEEYEGEYAAEEDEEYEDEEAEYEEAESENAESEDEEEDDGEHEQLELFEEEQAEADEPALEAAPPEPEPEPAAAAEVEADADPYAQGGLLRRLQARGPQSKSDGDRPHTAFDWRGRPIK